MIKIREQIDTDADDVKSIIAVATNELRSIYRPVKTNLQNKTEKPIYIVAIVNESVVGSAEYIISENSILVRGLAVSPVHRRKGVAKAIIEHAGLWAKKEGKSQLTLSTVKETGNSNCFLRMGFTVDSEEISEIFESVDGGKVTLMKMSKKIT